MSRIVRSTFISLALRLPVALAVPLPSLAAAQGGQPSIVSVTFTPASVPGGTNATAVVTISQPAGNNGFSVSLSLNSNVAQLSSSSVTIGPNLTSTQIVVTTTPTTALQLATLTASAHNDAKTANLTVTPPAVRTLALSPTTVTAGQTTTATITLNGPAPSGGTIVALAKNAAAVAMQAADTISAGQTSTTFVATTSNVSSQTPVTLSATAGGATQSATLTVLPASLSVQSVAFVDGTLKSATHNIIRVVLTQPAPAGGAFVQLNAAAFPLFGGGSATAVDTVPAGQTSGLLGMRPPPVSSDKPFTLTATFAGLSTSIPGTVLAPRLIGIEMPDSVVVGFTPTARLVFDATMPSSGMPVTVTTDNPAVGTNGFHSGSSNEESIGLPITPVANRTTVHITFQVNNQSATRALLIIPSPPTLTSFVVSPSSARANGTVTLTATLSSMAPTGGVNVVIGVPSTVAGMTPPPAIPVAAGATTGSVQLRIPSFVPSSVTVPITATFNGVSKTANLTISP